MKNKILAWASVLCLPLTFIYAQEPKIAPSVTVVFAPDASLASQPRLHSLDTPPALVLRAMTGGRIPDTGNPVEFSAPGGLIGVRTVAESVMAVTAVAGEDGKLRSSCADLPTALDRLKAARTIGRPAGKEIANDR